jgi:hypothetical protein
MGTTIVTRVRCGVVMCEVLSCGLYEVGIVVWCAFAERFEVIVNRLRSDCEATATGKRLQSNRKAILKPLRGDYKATDKLLQSG